MKTVEEENTELEQKKITLAIFKKYYEPISSSIWFLILVIYSHSIYYSSKIIIDDLTKNKFILTFLFILQGISFALPVMSLKILKKIFGYNNIIHRTYSKKRIANSKILSTLNNLFDGETIVVLTFLSSIIIYTFFQEIGHNFFDSLNYTFTHSFWAILLFDNNIDLFGITVIAYLFISDLLFTVLNLIILIGLILFAIHLPYIFGIILILNFLLKSFFRTLLK